MAKDLVPTNFRGSDEYKALIEECQAIIDVGVYNIRANKIIMMSQLGERISKDPLYERYAKGNSTVFEMMANDIGIARSELYRSIQFFEKFGVFSLDSENWNKFEEGKSISWGKIKVKYLPAVAHESCKHTAEKIEAWRCRKCKKVFTYNPNEK